MKRSYTTVMGHEIRLDVAPKVAAFLGRMELLAGDRATTEQTMIGVAYSTENPMLDQSPFPGRGGITKEVLADPAYRVMTDLLFRKRIAERKIDIEKIAARYTMTIAEAAAERGVHESAIRQAIASVRLASWYRDGRHYLDPRAVRALEVGTRAPTGPRRG